MWDGAEMPFEDGNASTNEAHCRADSNQVEDAVHRVKRILDSKYHVTRQMLKRFVKNKLSQMSNSKINWQCYFASAKRRLMDS